MAKSAVSKVNAAATSVAETVGKQTQGESGREPAFLGAECYRCEMHQLAEHWWQQYWGAFFYEWASGCFSPDERRLLSNLRVFAMDRIRDIRTVLSLPETGDAERTVCAEFKRRYGAAWQAFREHRDDAVRDESRAVVIGGFVVPHLLAVIDLGSLVQANAISTRPIRTT